MANILNGEIVAAVSEWQGAFLILASLCVAYLFRRVRQVLHSSDPTSR